jgi:hypothetical protein
LPRLFINILLVFFTMYFPIKGQIAFLPGHLLLSKLRMAKVGARNEKVPPWTIGNLLGQNNQELF